MSANAVPLTTSPCPPSRVTSSRRIHDNGKSTDANAVSVSSTERSRSTTLKGIVKAEPRRSASSDGAADSEVTGTICDVTSSVTSYSTPVEHPGYKADRKDSFKLPAWVYCTRYSDRPSSGSRLYSIRS